VQIVKIIDSRTLSFYVEAKELVQLYILIDATWPDYVMLGQVVLD
jgi:hypothetical protein